MEPTGEREIVDAGDGNASENPFDRFAALAVWGVALVFALAAVRLFRLIDEHAVNVLYWDQYTLYQAFVEGADLWEQFRWQHGPHRQGIAFWITGWVAEATAWNARVEAFVVGVAIVAAAGLALVLRRRIAGPIGWGDAAIPLLILTPAQYGIFVHTPNLSHGAGPLVLLLVFALGFTIERRALRYAGLVALSLVAIHTGFGVFVGGLAPVLLGLCAWHARREDGGRGWRWPLVASVLCIGWIGLFFVDYTTAGGLAKVRPEGHPASGYAIYAALMFANVLGLKGLSGLSLGVGGFVLIAAVAAALESGVRVLRGVDRPAPHLAIASLCGFTLLYVATTAYGRLDLGLAGSQSTRYVPLVVPALLGLYLRSQRFPSARWRRGAAALALAGIVLATLPMHPKEVRVMERLSSGKRLWVEAYLETGSIPAANQRAKLKVFPHGGSEFPRILAFMRAQGLGLFAGRAEFAPPVESQPPRPPVP